MPLLSCEFRMIPTSMKKNRLTGSIEFQFDLFGLVCNVKEYKLAWHLNQALELELSKQEDVKIEFSNQQAISISSYKYENEHLTVELLQNKLVSYGAGSNNYLLPELSRFDYLLKVRDETGEVTSENVVGLIRGLFLVEYVVKLNFDELKSKENLLY